MPTPPNDALSPWELVEASAEVPPGTICRYMRSGTDLDLLKAGLGPNARLTSQCTNLARHKVVVHRDRLMQSNLSQEMRRVFLKHKRDSLGWKEDSAEHAWVTYHCGQHLP